MTSNTTALLVYLFALAVFAPNMTLAQSYYLNQKGDTTYVDLLREGMGRLYFFDNEGQAKYVYLKNIAGFRFEGEPYFQITVAEREDMRTLYWLINDKPDSVYQKQIGFEGGVNLRFIKRPTAAKASHVSRGGYPHIYAKSRPYENALGDARILMPHFGIVYKDEDCNIYRVGVGYNQSDFSLSSWRGPTEHIKLKNSYLFWEYESPIRTNWIKIKRNTGELRYPWYGLGINLNSKNLSYQSTTLKQSSNGWSTQDISYKEIVYGDNSMLIGLNAKLGGYWQIKSFFFKWGLNVSLVSLANGQYGRREYYHSFTPDIETDKIEEGTYAKVVPPNVENSGFFLRSGLYLN